MADQVLYSGVACITDLMVKEGLINLDFADVRSVMREMGRAMMGTGEASGPGRAMQAAEAAIANPLLDETSMKGAQGLLISITGGRDLTLFEVDEAATRIREEVDPDANIILGATFDEALEGLIRVSVVATGIDRVAGIGEQNIAEMRAAAAKPLIRPSAAVAPAPAAVQPAQAVSQAPKTVDQIAQTIRSAEAEMERELGFAAHQQPSQDFRPQSKLFASSPAEAPAALRPAQPVQQAAPAPVAQAPVYHAPEQVAAPAPRMQPPQAPVYQEPAPVARQPEPVRMPKVEDFPPVVKAEMDHRDRATPVAQEERGPMGLLKRITNSLGRREEEEVPSDMMDAPSMAPQRRAPLSPEASLYAPRRGQLDDHGRATPSSSSHHDDDQLEIPAFLRRQSN
jgi:cell division protein FtsZ